MFTSTRGTALNMSASGRPAPEPRRHPFGRQLQQHAGYQGDEVIQFQFLEEQEGDGQTDLEGGARQAFRQDRLQC